MRIYAWERKNMSNKTLVAIGVFVVICIGAFLYLDPLDLDLFGKERPATVAVATPTVAAAPPAKPAAQSSKAPSPASRAQMPANKPQVPVAAPKPASEPVRQAVAAVTASASAPAAEAQQAQAPLPPLKLDKSIKIPKKMLVAKVAKPKNLDLRFCLKLKTDAEIAKCAGET
jgi:hypothetical protein